VSAAAAAPVSPIKLLNWQPVVFGRFENGHLEATAAARRQIEVGEGAV